jgi:hypothetical protein
MVSRPAINRSKRALAAAAAPDDRHELPGRNVQVDAAQHLVVAERLAQAANGQRQSARQGFRTVLREPGLLDDVGGIHRLGIRGKKTKGHACSQCF